MATPLTSPIRAWWLRRGSESSPLPPYGPVRILTVSSPEGALLEFYQVQAPELRRARSVTLGGAFPDLALSCGGHGARPLASIPRTRALRCHLVGRASDLGPGQAPGGVAHPYGRGVLRAVGGGGSNLYPLHGRRGRGLGGLRPPDRSRALATAGGKGLRGDLGGRPPVDSGGGGRSRLRRRIPR